MKIERVKLRGFVGIRKGLSLDEISLDLSGLSGLIALAGPNGKGKSTLMECMTPWRSLASRAGALQHHTYLRDSLKEISWTWNGDTYRSLIKVDSQTGKSEAFLYRGEVPVASGNKGYDNTLREMLGSEALFFASVFACQGGTKLSDMTTGQLKGLFSEFLRLDRLIAYEETSKAARNRLSDQAAALENERVYLEGEVTKKETLSNIEVPALMQKLLAKQGVSESFKETIERAETSLKDLRSRVESNRVHEARLKDLQAAGRKLAEDWQKEKEAGERTIRDLKDKAQQVEISIGGLSRLIEKKEEIEAASETETMLNASIQAVSEEISANEALLRDVLDEMNQAGQRRVKLEGQIEVLKKDDQLRSLKNTIASLKEKKSLLDKKDPACTSRTCAFIVNALKAEELPTIEKALSDRLELIDKKNKTLVYELGTTKASLDGKSALRSSLHANIKSLSAKAENEKKNLQAARALSSLKSQLDQATAKLEGLNKRKEELAQEITSEEDKLTFRRIEVRTAMDANASDVQIALQQVDPLAAEDLESAEAELKDLIASKESCEKEIASLRLDLAGLESKIKDCEEKERRLQEIQEKRSLIIREAGQWEYLKNACPAIRLLEIDSVTPTLCFHANQILGDTYGPNATVKIITQDPETGKDVFWIKVIDEDGDEVTLSNRSGGQQVWALKALRLGMLLHSKEKSGFNFKTAFADEESGALDIFEESQSAQKFTQLYRSFMKAGDFESMFYISHQKECIQMADEILWFGTEKSLQINLPGRNALIVGNGKGIEIE